MNHNSQVGIQSDLHPLAAKVIVPLDYDYIPRGFRLLGLGVQDRPVSGKFAVPLPDFHLSFGNVGLVRVVIGDGICLDANRFPVRFVLHEGGRLGKPS